MCTFSGETVHVEARDVPSNNNDAGRGAESRWHTGMMLNGTGTGLSRGG